MTPTPLYQSPPQSDHELSETHCNSAWALEETPPTWKELWFERDMLTSVRRGVFFAVLLGAMLLLGILFAFTLARDVPDPTPQGFHDLGNADTCLQAVIQELRTRPTPSR